MNKTEEKQDITSPKNQKENKLYCEYFKEWISEEKGCKNLKEYCPYRNQCIIYFYSQINKEE